MSKILLKQAEELNPTETPTEPTENGILTLAEACNVLHVDQGTNDAFIKSLIDAVPGYIEVTTGMPGPAQKNDALAKTAAGFLITLWYYSDHADDRILNRTIDSLLKALAAKENAAQDYIYNY